MSFKVEIEIKGYDSEYCGGCNLFDSPDSCNLFWEELEGNDDGESLRLPECLEAEKKYKEKIGGHS